MYPRAIKTFVLSILFLGSLCVAGISFAAEPPPSDSLRVDTLIAGIGSLEVASDSVTQSSALKSWFLPFGVIAATGAAIYLLFSVRSR